jgi:hypothetical protein
LCRAKNEARGYQNDGEAELEMGGHRAYRHREPSRR